MVTILDAAICRENRSDPAGNCNLPLGPGLPVFDDGFGHVLAGLAQPFGLLGAQVLLHCRNRCVAPQVNVSGFPAHGLEKLFFIPFAGKGAQLDAAAVGRKPAQQPMPAKANERINRPDRLSEDALVMDSIVSGFALGVDG